MKDDLQVTRSRPASRIIPTRAELVRLYVKRRLSIRDVAAELDCTRDMVHRALHHHGIEARPQGEKRSALQGIPLERLQGMVARLGLRGAARELGVDHGNLARYLRARAQ